MYMQALAKAAARLGDGPEPSELSPAWRTAPGISGSTAWHGAFRFRQYLKGVKRSARRKSASRLSPTAACGLSSKRTNTGRSGEASGSATRAGCSWRKRRRPSAEKLARKEQVAQVFLPSGSGSTAQGRNVSHSPTANNCAATVFAKETDAIKLGFRKADFEAAMRDLFAAGQIKVESYRSPGATLFEIGGQRRDFHAAPPNKTAFEGRHAPRHAPRHAGVMLRHALASRSHTPIPKGAA